MRLEDEEIPSKAAFEIASAPSTTQISHFLRAEEVPLLPQQSDIRTELQLLSEEASRESSE